MIAVLTMGTVNKSAEMSEVERYTDEASKNFETLPTNFLHLWLNMSNHNIMSSHNMMSSHNIMLWLKIMLWLNIMLWLDMFSLKCKKLVGNVSQNSWKLHTGYLPSKFLLLDVAVSCGYDTWFAVRLVKDYTTSHFTWSILGYSEIDQIHLSSEDQCVSHHLPPVDCHTGKSTE